MVRSIVDGVHTHYNYDADNNLNAVRIGSQPVYTALYDAAGGKVYELNRTQSPWQYQEPDTYVYARELETTMEPGYWARRATQAAEQPATPEQPTPAPEPQQGGEEPQTQTITHSETIAEQQASSMFAYGFGLGLLQLFGWYNGALSGHTSAQLRESWPEMVTTGEHTNTWDEEIPFDMAIPEVAYEPEVIAALEQQGYAEQDIRYLWVSGITNEEAHTYLADTIPGDVVQGTYIVYDISYITNIPFEHTQMLYTQGLKGVYKDAYVYGNSRETAHSLYYGDSSYLYNGMGSVAQTVNGGEVTQSLTYDAYGNVQTGGNDFEPYYGYNAEQYIPEAGVQYLRARNYMPATASFLSQDTYLGEMDEPATHNLYTYAQNNPINYADPSGHLSAAKITDKLEEARKAAQSSAKGKATATSNTRTTTTTANAKATTTSTKTKANTTAGTKVTNNTIKGAISGGVQKITDKISSNNATSNAASTAQQTPVYGGGKSLKEVAKDKNNHGVVMPTRADALEAAAKAGKREFCGPVNNTATRNNQSVGNVMLLSAGTPAADPVTWAQLLAWIWTGLVTFGLAVIAKVIAAALLLYLLAKSIQYIWVTYIRPWLNGERSSNDTIDAMEAEAEAETGAGTETVDPKIAERYPEYTGEPGEVKVDDSGSYTKERLIGKNGLTARERHHTPHSNPNAHSNPHDHEVTWENGHPNYGSPENYWDGNVPSLSSFY